GQSVGMALLRRQQHEALDPSLLVSEEPAWDLLERLDGLPDKFLRGVLRDACGHDANARTPALLEWLATQEPKPVVELPEREEEVAVLDLSVSSPDAELRATDDTERFTERVFGRMRELGARIGVGRYLEPRGFYLTDGFAGRPGDPRERRSVQLGIDLFVEEGTEVRARLGSKVTLVEDHEARPDYGPTVVLEHRSPRGRFWTLYGHLDAESVAAREPGKELAPGEAFARIGAPPGNGDWPPHLHFQIVTHFLGYGGDFPGVAAPRERSVWASFSPDPNVLLRLPHETTCREP